MRIREITGFVVILALVSCGGNPPETPPDKKSISREVREMLNNYYTDVNRHGLMAEFNYLDQSPDFFWNAPGYSSTLSYDSVRAEVERNAGRFREVSFYWDTLQVFPLSLDIASYSGIVRGTMTDTSGVETEVSLLESGTAIRRKNRWKILNGHTTVLH